MRICAAAAILFTLVVAVFFCEYAFCKEACAPDAEWCPPSIGPVVTWTAPTADQGELDVQGLFFYNRTRGVFDGEGSYKSFKNKDRKWQWQEQLFCQYGVTDDLEICGLMQGIQNIAKIDGASAESSGFGDTYGHIRYTMVKEKKYTPHLTALFQVKFPTGKYQKLNESRLGTDYMGANTGGGSYEQCYGIMMSKCFEPFMLHFDMVFGFPVLTKVDGVKVKYGNYMNIDAGAEYFFYKGFNLMIEVNYLVQGDDRFDGALTPSTDHSLLNICPGFGWSSGSFMSLVAYQRTLAGINNDVNDSIIFTCEYDF